MSGPLRGKGAPGALGGSAGAEPNTYLAAGEIGGFQATTFLSRSLGVKTGNLLCITLFFIIPDGVMRVALNIYSV